MKLIGNTQTPVNGTIEQVVSTIAGKTIRYRNKGDSSVVDSHTRYFKIRNVDEIATGEKSGDRFVLAQVLDLDDNAEMKFRRLTLDHIELVV